LIVLVFLLVDFLRYDWNMSLFLARKFLDLIEYLQFWR